MTASSRLERFFSFQRLTAILTKEFIQMRRDRITFAMMLAVPLMQLVLFGYAINNDPKDLPTAVVATSQDRYSRAFIAAMENTGYYEIERVVPSVAEGEAMMERGDVVFLVTFPSDFATAIERGEEPQVLVEADASDPAAASGALSALSTLAAEAVLREMPDGGHGVEPAPPVDVVIHRRYNPEGISQFNTVPGLLGVILQMTMMMMTSMALTRESERGTMENLLAMPASPVEIMLGKVLPYLVVGAVQVVVVLAAAAMLFGVPFVGSLTLLLFAVLLFVFSLVLLGYTISTFARTQMQALQLTFFIFLPSVLLSGFMFPFRGMPDWAQWIGETFPLTHFLRVTRAVMLRGADWQAVAFETGVLALFIVIFAAMALTRFRRTLD